jgi:hypothetical protein
LETCENHEGFFDIDIENGALWGGKIAHMLYMWRKKQLGFHNSHLG